MKLKLLTLLLFISSLSISQANELNDSAKKVVADAEYIIKGFSLPDDEIEQYEKAISLFTTAISLGIQDPVVWFEKGICETKLKKYVEAIWSLTQTIKLSNEINKYYYNRAAGYIKTANGYISSGGVIEYGLTLPYCYAYRADCKRDLEDYRGAISDYTKALELMMTDSAHSYYFRGLCKFNLKDFAGAKTDMTSAIKIDFVGKALAYYWRGGCNYNLQLKELACKDWSLAGELGSPDAYAAIKEYCK